MDYYNWDGKTIHLKCPPPTRRLALSIMVIVAVLSIVYSLALNLSAMVIGLVYLVLGVCILMLFSACFGSMRRSYLDLPFPFFWHVCRGSLSRTGRIDRENIEIYLFVTNHNLTGLGNWYASGLFFCINMRKERMPMAVTRRIPMHMNKGKTISQSLSDRTEYAKNPEKTDKGELVMIPRPWIKSLCCPNANRSRLLIAAIEAWSDCLPDSSVLQARRDHTGGSEPIGTGASSPFYKR